MSTPAHNALVRAEQVRERIETIAQQEHTRAVEHRNVNPGAAIFALIVRKGCDTQTAKLAEAVQRFEDRLSEIARDLSSTLSSIECTLTAYEASIVLRESVCAIMLAAPSVDTSEMEHKFNTLMDSLGIAFDERDLAVELVTLSPQ